LLTSWKLNFSHLKSFSKFFVFSNIRNITKWVYSDVDLNPRIAIALQKQETVVLPQNQKIVILNQNLEIAVPVQNQMLRNQSLCVAVNLLLWDQRHQNVSNLYVLGETDPVVDQALLVDHALQVIVVEQSVPV